MAQQLILPMIPRGATEINNQVCVFRAEDEWTYYLGTHPIYSHRADDQRMFRVITSLLINTGACRPVDILRTFGVSKSSVMRSLRKLREGGIEGFFKPRQRRRGGKFLTPQALEKAQQLLDQGISRREIADELDLRYDTLHKAISDGRLRKAGRREATRDKLSGDTPDDKPDEQAGGSAHKVCPTLEEPVTTGGESCEVNDNAQVEDQETSCAEAGEILATTKSSRDVIDVQAANGMGTACTRSEERVLAAFGVCDGAPVRFEPCLDVPKGGVLCALPSLLMNGLLEGAQQLLSKVEGYYRCFHILILLAFMSLCRIKTVEQLRGHAPGEFGKILGLDRVPEVRCLRRKMDELSACNAADLWAAHLARHWMEADPQAVGTLYIDGHVRVYHGEQTKLPRRYVSRERLCLRGMTDYWVNDAVGRPFFVVEKVVDPGLLKTLEQDIVPRLIKDVPGQPTVEQLEEAPHLCRFVMVFDREGYSPVFFRNLWKKHRIGCLTYHKHPAEAWPQSWFSEHTVTMPNGEITVMKLAEMGSFVGTGKNGSWMREVRRLTESGHQTSLIGTTYEPSHTWLAAHMFSRWCQENFFRYMMQHFAIDLLQEYGTEGLPDTEPVVNPAWRELERSRNSLVNKLRYRRARFAELSIHPESESDEARYEKWLQAKALLLDEIEHRERELNELKAKLKETPKHITWAQMEEKDRFCRLLPGRKRLMDTSG